MPRPKIKISKRMARMSAVLFLLTILAQGWPSACPAFEDAIIAVVDDELITFKDLKDYAHSVYVGMVAEGLPDDQIKEVMATMETEGINKLIEDRLILGKANKIGLEVREELVNERIRELKDRYGSNQKFTDALIRSGATLTDLKNKIRDEMKLKYIVDHEVRSKIFVNPQEVTDYYEKNKETFGHKARVNLESIFIEYAGDKEAASRKAHEALKKIEAGIDFSEIVKEYSSLPSVGIVEHGQLLPEIEKTVFDLQVGQVSSSVETEKGIYIFKLNGKTPAEIRPLNDVKETIYDLLFKKKFKDRFMDWLGKLKKEAYIEIK